MRFIGNILWLILGGLVLGLAWLAVGLLWCLTLIGIPVGLQCFKLSSLAFWPFGRQAVFEGGPVSFLLNVAWFFLGGLELALIAAAVGLVYCLTVVGIPFGLQCFKFASLSMAPFGRQIVGC
ncbi:MAG: YccF domain-containing protein [Firmicutes bacterium]|nr:YccF domain-containing protein [Bacillota bacterium]